MKPIIDQGLYPTLSYIQTSFPAFLESSLHATLSTTSRNLLQIASLLVCLCSESTAKTFPDVKIGNMKVFFLGVLASLASADIGTAGPYSVPYLPTRCYGNDASRFPSGNLFAAVSEGLWDNGAACGRRYRMRCISSAKHACKAATLDVRVVDHAKKPGNTIDVSEDVWAQLVNTNSGEIRANIEFIQI